MSDQNIVSQLKTFELIEYWKKEAEENWDKAVSVANERDRILADIMSELQPLREFRDEVKGVVEFYGSERNWSPRTENETCYNRILNFDLSKHEYSCGDLIYTIGGNRARQLMQSDLWKDVFNE